MRRTHIPTLLLAMGLGFIGGYTANIVGVARQTHASDTLQAKRFELLDDSGARVAFWGSDKESHEIVLAFAAPDGNKLAALGVNSARRAFMNFNGSDGKRRFTVELADPSEKPSLALSDNTYEGRVTLGFLQTDYPSPSDDDWGLIFSGPGHRYIDFGVHKVPGKDEHFATLRLLGPDGKGWHAQ